MPSANAAARPREVGEAAPRAALRRGSSARRRGCRCRRWTRSAGSSGARLRVSYQLSRWPSKRSRPSIVVSVASIRAASSSRPDEAEVVRGQRREQAHADVGGRRAVRDPRLGDLLEVVRRQAVVLGAHEGREVAPGLAGDVGRNRRSSSSSSASRAAHGLAQRVGDERRRRPQERGSAARPRSASGRAAATSTKPSRAITGLAIISTRNRRAPARSPAGAAPRWPRRSPTPAAGAGSR